MPNWDVVEFDPLLDSANVAVEQWVNIGREIRDRYHMYDGFVVLHGTDTMAYTASALSFMLEGLGKPVILTGSQIPLCEVTGAITSSTQWSSPPKAASTRSACTLQASSCAAIALPRSLQMS